MADVGQGVERATESGDGRRAATATRWGTSKARVDHRQACGFSECMQRGYARGVERGVSAASGALRSSVGGSKWIVGRMVKSRHEPSGALGGSPWTHCRRGESALHKATEAAQGGQAPAPARWAGWASLADRER